MKEIKVRYEREVDGRGYLARMVRELSKEVMSKWSHGDIRDSNAKNQSKEITWKAYLHRASETEKFLVHSSHRRKVKVAEIWQQ